MTANEPAFPGFEVMSRVYSDNVESWQGLTKRELFAAMAMQGMLASITCSRWEENVMAGVVPACVEYADALLAELERSKA